MPPRLKFPTTRPFSTARNLASPLAVAEYADLLRSTLKLAAAEKHQKLEIPKKIAIAVSGGIDSMALAHLSSGLKNSDSVFSSTEFVAMIVDHNLRPDSAEEADKVEGMMEKLGIQSHRINLNLTPEYIKRSKSKIESLARKLRYKSFAMSCKEHKISHILTGHHGNDQAETLLMRLVKESGHKGLQGMTRVAKMPECEDVYGADKLSVLRPFLGVLKHRLKETLVKDNITWFEDPTNADPKMTVRNSIRALLTSPKSNEYLPESLSPRSLIALTERLAAQQAKLNDEIDWFLSRCYLRHIRASGVIQAVIPSPLLRFPVEFIGRVLARFAEVISPMDRIDMTQMIRVAQKVVGTTNPKNKEMRGYGGNTQRLVTALTENNVYWESVHCGPFMDQPDGVMLVCYRQPYSRDSKKSTLETDLDINEQNKWVSWDGRFWLRYKGDKDEAFWKRIIREKSRRVFITGTRKEVMLNLESQPVQFLWPTVKKDFGGLKKRLKLDAPGKSRTVLPVLCEESAKPATDSRFPYIVHGFPTFGVGGGLMGDWEWEPKKYLTVKGKVIGDTLVMGKQGEMVSI
ncbi:hypothetical protein H072_2626 [Dactylellina haptotyla CBS 200.50]|uniref:tRNA(Ile)-lysidine synthetase n=1 Tax=Dactylellina haptotyla (strain CBS 200.50) TaxID=1284197 RepID=S8BVD8_DACHA|nr:hypothetical protein H072_2626 [Dactylellina haptotyla CBS 200.50]